MAKQVKFNVGDILYCTSCKCNVELLYRWDRKPDQRTAWMCKVSPDGEKEFPVPEDELQNISLS